MRTNRDLQLPFAPARLALTDYLLRSHTRLILSAALLTRLLLFILSLLASYIPPLGAAPRLSPALPQTTLLERWTSTLLRWDAFHYADVALHGYVYTYEWAFFPGTPAVMHWAGSLLRTLKSSLGGEAAPAQGVLTLADVLQGGALAALVADLLSPLVLYYLTRRTFRSSSLALLVSLLSLLPTSTATLRHAPYAEPFFTLLSYLGMLCASYHFYAPASVCFALASVFRSNGMFLGGFIIWPLLIQPFVDNAPRFPALMTVLKSLLLGLFPLVPSILHQIIAFRLFCVDRAVPRILRSPLLFPYSSASNPPHTHPLAPLPPPIPFLHPSSDHPSSLSSTPEPMPVWCAARPPSLYKYVQHEYWHVGFLQYWRPNKISNFLFAAPVMALLLAFSFHHLRSVLWPQLQKLYRRFTARAHAHAHVHTALSLSSSSSPSSSPRVSSSRPPSRAPSPSASPASRFAPGQGEQTKSAFMSSALTPHAIHAILICTILLFFAHVQIVLRLAPSMPIIHWAAAWLLCGGRDVAVRASASRWRRRELERGDDDDYHEEGAAKVLEAYMGLRIGSGGEAKRIEVWEDEEVREEEGRLLVEGHEDESQESASAPSSPTRRLFGLVSISKAGVRLGAVCLEWRKLWTWYSLAWGAGSIVLWVAYFPPA